MGQRTEKLLAVGLTATNWVCLACLGLTCYLLGCKEHIMCSAQGIKYAEERKGPEWSIKSRIFYS